jgi:hypothetical protein
VQPFVLQYGRVAVDERRRIRRIATERPATEAVAVRVIMLTVRFLLARAFRGRFRALSRPLRPVAGPLFARLGVG